MNPRDVVVAALHAQVMRPHQHVGVGVAGRRLEAIGGELDQQPERVLEVDRVHEAAVLGAAVADAALVEALDRLRERGLRDREGEVVDAPGVGRRAAAVALAPLVREDGDQAPVARVEVQVALGLAIEVGLLEHERHAEHALPEVDRGLPAGADDRDVVDTLALQLAHQSSISFDLYSLRRSVLHGTSSTSACTRSASRTRAPIAAARGAPASRPRASSTRTDNGGSCLTPGARRRIATCPLTSGAKPPTTSRMAEGNTLTPRTISMSSVRPMQRTRGPGRPHGHGVARTSTWSRVRKRSSGAARWRRWLSTSSPVAPSSIASAAPVSGSISSRWTIPVAPRCIPSWCSHSPQSETPMSPMPIASVTRAPQPASSWARKAGSPPPGSPASSSRRTLEPARSTPWPAAHSRA